MAIKTTHVRIEKSLLERKNKSLPDYTANEIFKLGLNACIGINKAGQIIYGKNVWNRQKKK